MKKSIDLAVKFVKGSDTIIEGLAIPYGGPRPGGKDLDFEDFGPDTDFAFDWFPEGRPVIYHHGLAGAKTSVQGRQTEYELTDEGVFARAELDKSAKYHATVAKMVDAGQLYFSSGTMPHLVQTTATKHITHWPWVELSLTPTPANPFAVVHAVKSTDLIDHLSQAEIPVPAALIAAGLKSLDRPVDGSLPDGEQFAEFLDRLLVEASARVHARKDWYLKSGRVLSAATRARLGAHPDQLRTLASDIEELLATSDGGEEASKRVYMEFLLQESRLNGVPIFGTKSAADDVMSATAALNFVLALIESESPDADDPDAAEDQADVALLGTARDALTAYIASTSREVGSADDLEDIAAEPVSAY